MEDKPQTIGLIELLSGVDRDLEELRKKHPSDYGVKNLTMWWELEKDRLVTRHGGSATVRKPRRLRIQVDLGIGFFIAIAAIGMVAMLLL